MPHSHEEKEEEGLGGGTRKPGTNHPRWGECADMRHSTISPRYAVPLGRRLPLRSPQLIFGRFWGNSDFDPYCLTHTGAGQGPKVTLRGPKVTLHFLAAHGHSGHVFPTLASKSSLVCTPVAYFDMVGARRAALCGPCVGKPDLRLIRPQILIEGIHTGPER